MRAIYLARYASMCLLFSGGLSMAFGQTTYYVANSGNDGNTGRSTNSPFQTIAKINSLVLQPGDQVLFQRNNTFRGTLQVRQSGTSAQPIVIDAYGSGNKPVLAGSASVINWANIGNNVWQASCPSCGDRVTGLYRDNTALPLGRYPNLDASNKGYLTVQSHAGKVQLTGQQNFSTNWVGGEVVFRPVQWILNRSTITGQNGNTLTLASAGTYDIADGWGYFIQNHPATLDQNGEWYYNPSNKSILLFDSQNNPNNQSIAATTYNEVVNLTNVSFVTVRNLQLSQSLATNLSITNGANISITGNDITQAGEDGIVIRGDGHHVSMENNLIDEVNNNGVDISAYLAITFRGNTLRRIGLVAGRGRSGDGTYVGFMSASKGNTLIENNVLDNIGYNALNFASSTTIQRNQISNFCLTKSDGSGLYIWNGNQQPMSDIHLISNVVYNGIGAPEGTPGGAYSGANGIYLDDCTTNIEVANNSVYNCRGLGIYLHGSSNITLTGNTSFNNGEGQLAVTTAGGCQPRSNLIQNNIFVSKQAGQFNVKYESAQNDLASFGQIDNNVYARPFEDTYTIRAVYNSTNGADLSLADWRSRYGKDLNTVKSPVTYSTGNPDDVIFFAGNPTTNTIQVPLTGTYRDARNTIYTGQVSVAAFSSIVLFKDVTASMPLRNPENPATTVAGLDYGYYEGSWNTLPDFGSLTPLKTGNSSIPDRTIRSRDENYGIRYTGFVTVPADGVYTFYTNSDDGSKLLIGTTEVVNNDGSHGEQERSGTIGLRAGTHAISLLYYQGGGGQALTVSYSGPSLTKQAIPASALVRVPSSNPPVAVNLRNPENPANTVSGLDYNYYEGSWGALPNFSSLNPIKAGTSGLPDLSGRSRDENYGIRYTGFVTVPADGVYTFYTNSDDGSKLLIGTTEVVNNDGGHAEQERSGTIGLKAGTHAISIPYFQGGGGQAMTVSYSGPGLGKQTIPASAYRRVGTSNPPDTGGATLRNPENPANTVAGLDYGYFEGSWGALPNFSSLNPVKVGVNSLPDLSVRSRDNDYGLFYSGYITVPADGVYTFYTNSDDGSKLLIGTTEVVNNDGGHAEQERSGTIGLKAGTHAISIPYFQGGGGQAMTVSYSGPGLGKQTIPASAYRRVSTTVGGDGTGLRADYFNNQNAADPIVLTRTDATVDFDWGTGSPSSAINTDYFSVRWSGLVKAPVTGNYTFSTTTDDGVRLWVNGKLVIDDWNGHAPITNNSPTIALVAGQRYEIKMEYFDSIIGAVARLLWAYPGQGQQIIPQSYLYPGITTNRMAAATTSPDFTPDMAVQVYPVPARDEVQVRYYAEQAGELALQLTSVGAYPVMQTKTTVVQGENIIRIPVRDYNRGMYILSLIQGTQRVTKKVLLAD